MSFNEPPPPAGTGEATFSLNPERELTEQEVRQLRETAREQIDAERREFNERARRRLIGYAVVTIAIVCLLLPVLIALGFETGLMVAVFKFAADLL